MNKPKIMMHFINKGKTGGPNVVFERIMNSEYLKSKFEFIELNHPIGTGPKIDIKMIQLLRKKIKDSKPDIIHISGMQSAGFHCMIAAFLAGCKKRIITTHGFSGDAIGFTGIKRFILNSIMEPLTLILANKILGISDFTTQKTMVKKWGKNKTSFVYNFPPDTNSEPKKPYIRNEFNISANDIVFTCVCRITIDKGLDVLAKSIKNLTETPNIKFIIVGDGNYEETFKEMVTEEIKNHKVVMAGKRDDVLDILRESDVFVMPTIHENLGNVFLEASVAGTPSIGTNVGGVPEIIIDGYNGFLVPVFDSNALTEAILKLYKDPDLKKIMGKKALERVSTVFNPDKLSRELESVYNSLLNTMRDK